MKIFLLLLIVFLYWVVGNSTNLKKRKFYICSVSIALVLFSTLRHPAVGNDTFAYLNAFDRVHDMSWADVFEGFFQKLLLPSDEIGKDPGFLIFSKVCSTLTNNHIVYLFFISLLTICSLGILLLHYAKNTFDLLFSYAFFVVFIFHYMPNSAIRQSLAASFLYISIVQIDKKNTLLFICLLLLGATFHRSVLFVGALLYIVNLVLKNSQCLYRLSLLIVGIIVLFGQQIVNSFGFLGETYSHYTSGTYYLESGASKPYMMIIFMVLLFALTFLVKKEDEEFKKKKIVYIGGLLGLWFTPLIIVDPSMLRLLSYLFVFYCLCVSKDLLCFPIRFRSLILCCIFISYLHIAHKDTYHFCWENVMLHHRYK